MHVRARELHLHSPFPSHHHNHNHTTGPTPAAHIRHTQSHASLVTHHALVHLHATVNSLDEGEARQEADSAGEQRKGAGGDHHVAEVDGGGHGSLDAQLRREVPDGVGEQEEARARAGEEGAPPPAPVLGAELEVAHDDAHLGAGGREDEHDHEEEAEDVIDLVLPERRHDEGELDADGAEAEEAAHEDGEARAVVPRGRRHHALDHLGAAGHLVDVLLEPEVAAHEHEGDGQAEPQPEQLEDGAHGHGGGAPLCCHHDFQDNEHQGEEQGIEQARHERVALPVLALEELEEPRGVVAREGSREEEADDRALDEPAAVRRRQEAEQREDQRHRHHDDELDARAHAHRKQHRERRRAEDVAVHVLPALLRLVVLRVVVLGDVAAQVAEEDHGHDAGE
mmetsp:Transcript_43498/g.136440  ORF Transcript_43498/g.136440 Transcript_43498/m.136440 type:complete len:396 (+) Transcript_43498:719-1906(+)